MAPPRKSPCTVSLGLPLLYHSDKTSYVLCDKRSTRNRCDRLACTVFNENPPVSILVSRDSPYAASIRPPCTGSTRFPYRLHRVSLQYIPLGHLPCTASTTHVRCSVFRYDLMHTQAKRKIFNSISTPFYLIIEPPPSKPFQDIGGNRYTRENYGYVIISFMANLQNYNFDRFLIGRPSHFDCSPRDSGVVT